MFALKLVLNPKKVELLYVNDSSVAAVSKKKKNPSATRSIRSKPNTILAAGPGGLPRSKQNLI